MDMIELNFSFSKPQYERLIRQYMLQNRMLMTLLLVSGVMMIPAIVLTIIFWKFDVIALLMIIFEIILLLIWGFMFWYAPHKAYIEYQKEPSGINIAFAENEVHLVSLDRIVKTGWTVFARAIETRDFFIMFLNHEEETYIALPKEIFAPAEAIGRFRQWVKASAIAEKKLAKN